MKREEYNACIARGMSGKQLPKEERRLEFCIIAKVCSGKATDREAAKLICSQPKQPKPMRAKKGGNCQDEVLKLAHCMADKIDMNLASNINSVELAIINSMMECKCPKQ